MSFQKKIVVEYGIRDGLFGFVRCLVRFLLGLERGLGFLGYTYVSQIGLWLWSVL